MKNQFEGKVALVTGGGSGIGRATAKAFSDRGACVAIVDISIDNGEETVRMINDSGGEAIFIKADVSRSNDVEYMIKSIVDKYGRLDFAHNNAGIVGPGSSTVDCTEDMWDNIINTNLKSVWLCMKFEIPIMLKQGAGAIVNTSSIAGLVGMKSVPAYSASKHGIIGLTKTAALEYAEMGIRINAICPGTVNTALVGKRVPRRLNELHPIGRIGTPEEIAESVIWLCSNASSFITGHAMAIDGGRTAT